MWNITYALYMILFDWDAKAYSLVLYVANIIAGFQFATISERHFSIKYEIVAISHVQTLIFSFLIAIFSYETYRNVFMSVHTAYYRY